MGKRNNEKRRSKSEQRLDNQRHLSLIERDGKKYQGYSRVFTEKPHYELKQASKGVCILDEFERKMYNKIAKRDSKPIGNIILNLCGCKFCEAFEIDNCGKTEGFTCCTDYINDFIKNKIAEPPHYGLEVKHETSTTV